MRLLFLLLFLTLFKLAIVSKDTNNEDEDTTYTNSWAVKIEGGDEVANEIAETHGFINRGQVRWFMLNATLLQHCSDS